MVASIVVTMRMCAHRYIVLLLHHGGGLCLPVTLLKHLTRGVETTGVTLAEDILNFFYGLLLLDVGLAQAFQDTLLVAFEASRLVVLLTNLDDLTLYRFIFLVADLGPLLRCYLI